ncbi:uncharacterized protein LOC112561829 isoform X2 [Pomacea canaliculata]|uniref:uncharacterized protein LOC112561829 isoform X2 n=1 Tax=Pomacea canaliculata TaxID=400727 RepID=UPI000D7312B9|nr:uncharacterized protein LOC112561829 isoform X2 [Pomacea canaliculata]
MSQKFHRVRNGMADKETLEVCFAVDSDEDRDIVAEDDNTEGRTFEEEVPPQVCKNACSVRKPHMFQKAVWGFKRSTALTVFLKRQKRKEGESNVAFLARGRAEYAALSPLEKKKLATEAASNTLPETLEEKKEYLKQLMRQLHKVENVLAHIGATYYIEINFDDTNHTFAHDSIPRHVLQETRYPLQAPLSNVAYLRKCVQKIFNDAYAKALGKEECNTNFPYKRHSLSPVVKITGMPEGVKFKHPSNYGAGTLKQIVAIKANIKMELIAPSAPEVIQTGVVEHIFVAGESASEVVQTTLVQDIVAEDPSQCAAEVQTPVVAAIFTAEEPDTEVVQTTLVQDIFIVEDPALEVIQTPVVADIFMAEDPASEVVQRPVVADIFMAEDPASEMVQRPVVADIFVAEDPASQVVQTTLVQDMQEGPTSSSQISTVQDSAKQQQESGRKKKRTGTRKDSAKQQQESGETKQRTGLRTLWTAAEVLLVQQHFGEELAGLKPVSRSSIDSFLEQQTVVKRTSTALGNYLLRNRKKSRPDDQ